MLFVDRVLYSSTNYPHNYGFIPQTLCDDGDALVRFQWLPSGRMSGSMLHSAACMLARVITSVLRSQLGVSIVPCVAI